MASSSYSVKEKEGALLPWTTRAWMEEPMGKLDLTEEDATPMIVDDRDDDAKQQWALAGSPRRF